jgi:hypothetical protein
MMVLLLRDDQELARAARYELFLMDIGIAARSGALPS